MGFHKLCKYNSFWQKTAVFVELLNNIGNRQLRYDPPLKERKQEHSVSVVFVS